MNWSKGGLCLRIGYSIKSSPGIISFLALQGYRGESDNKKRVGEHLPLPSLSLGDAFLGSNRLGTSDTLFSCFDLSFKLGKLGLETREL